MRLKTTFLILLCIFFTNVFAADYYTASPNATLAGNSGAVNANWTTNADGLTGLTAVAIAATDNLIVLNGGVATITAGMSIGTLNINAGGKIIHNNNASASTFNINGLLTWNGNIKTLNATTGSNFFNVNGDVSGATALHDGASTRGVYMGGDGLRTINLNQVPGGIISSTSVGLLIVKNHSLAGNCIWYSPLIYNQDCTLDLGGYNLQVSSIKGGTINRLIKGAANSGLTISGGSNPSVIYIDPVSSTLNNFTVNNDFSTGTSTVAVNATSFTVNSFSKSSGGNTTWTGDFTVNTLLNFGISTGTTYTGTLQVNGNFSLANNGSMNVQAKGATVSTQYDQLSVTGNINLGTSTTIKPNMLNSYVPPAGTLFNFAKSTGGTITGSFQIIQNPYSFVTTLTYPSANTVQAELTKICTFSLTPDLPLVTSNQTVETEIETIVQRFSDSYLGTTEPTAAALSSAIASYNMLNISITGNNITGSITNYNQTAFLKTFAQQIKFHPEDEATFTKALNTVWLVSDKLCKGTLAPDYNQYDYRVFALPAILIPRIKDNLLVKSLFENVLYKQNQFDYIWEPNVNADASVGHNVDHIGNTGVVTMAYVKWIDAADERFRYMTAFKRQMETFMNYSVGTEDGIKPDGSGFHHWSSYPSYMYDLNTEADIIYHLRGTSFQVSTASYLRLRDALMAQLMFTNDNTTRFLTMAGRKPEEIATTVSRYSFRNMALAGGSILGTGASDPVMANIYVRLWGGYTPFGDGTKAPFNAGYFQFNHSMAGIYRKDNWLAICKGFNDNMQGTETYANANRYGRYQSYGAINIVYPGDAPTGNGFDYTTWDWNYNPGTTVIRLPWDKLHAEKTNIDERQQKKFAGSLSFINKNSNYLKAVHGTYGMFAMDFQEVQDRAWGPITYSPVDNHNPTFVFKKSVFTFDNMLVCLGSNIGNNDAVNTTLTTLYQRKTIVGNKEQVNVDNNLLNTSTYSNTYAGSANHWLVDNFGTGFYVFAGSGTIKLTRADQQTPQHSIPIASQNVASNPIGNYAIGYIDHGTVPSDQGYEYICIPQTTTTDMTGLDSQIGAGNKPYIVHRKDNIAHIVEYKPSNEYPVFGYAFFAALSGLNNTGLLTGADYPCLVMSRYDSTQKNLKIAVSNPDIGFEYRMNTPSISKQINIKIKGTNWQIAQANTQASIAGTANGETTIQFTTVDGLPVEISLSRVLTSQTISFDAIPAKINTDPAFNLTATASSALAVSYTSSNTAVATISGSTVTIIGEGSSTITASQAGNDIYEAAIPVEQTLKVNTAVAAIADAYVGDGSYTASNFGTATGLTIKKGGTSYNREVYLKFDLSSINNFDSALLRLNIAYSGASIAATTWQVYYVPTDTWLENGINWSRKPASGSLLATINGQNSGWAEWDISSQVLAELAGDKILSLRLVSTVINSAADVTFNSKENTNASLRPQLLLTSGEAPQGLSTPVAISDPKNNVINKETVSDHKDMKVQAYPNPVKDVLHVNLTGYSGAEEARLFDIFGRTLLRQALTNGSVDFNVSGLSAGLYMVRLYGNNKSIATVKIVKL
jgi:hypothetical protein